MIKGDYAQHDDTTFTVESYDAGITLLTVDVDGHSYPVELTDDARHALIRDLTNPPVHQEWESGAMNTGG